jgi:DNA-binding transcriptional ArsR family regulator
MSLKRQLNKLESQSVAIESGDLLPTIQENGTVLASLLGRIDALWWTHRYNSKSSIAIHQHRRRYRQLGVEWKSGGADSAKSDQRLRDRLERAGIVKLSRSGGSVFLKLTPQAEQAIRQLCGLRTIPLEVQKLYFELWGEMAQEKIPEVRSGGWILENYFFNTEHKTRVSGWFEFEEKVIPFLVSGALESKSSTVLNMFYRVTDIPHSGVEPLEGIKTDATFRDSYLDTWMDEFDKRENLKPLDPHEIFIPLSASK